MSWMSLVVEDAYQKKADHIISTFFMVDHISSTHNMHKAF